MKIKHCTCKCLTRVLLPLTISFANTSEYFLYSEGDIPLNLVINPCFIQSTNISDIKIRITKGSNTPKWSIRIIDYAWGYDHYNHIHV